MNGRGNASDDEVSGSCDDEASQLSLGKHRRRERQRSNGHATRHRASSLKKQDHDSWSAQFSLRANSLPSPQLPTLKEQLCLAAVIERSPHVDEGSIAQSNYIFQNFNHDVEAGFQEKYFTFSATRNLVNTFARLMPGEFLIVRRNNVVALIKTDKPAYVSSTLFSNLLTTLVVNKVVKSTDLYYGSRSQGKHVLNVPVGCYAKAKVGNKPKLYGPGPHVILDPHFQFDPHTGLVNQGSPLIRHETITILQVPAGKYAKIWIGATPYLLPFQEAPYVFNTPLLTLGATPNQDSSDYLVNASDDLIIHGPIKRVAPLPGSVAVSSINGKSIFIYPRPDGNPTIIQDPSHIVFEHFLQLGIQQLNIPTKEKVRERSLLDASNQVYQSHYEPMQTQDGLNIGVKLRLFFKVIHPEQTLAMIGNQIKINQHIENLILTTLRDALFHISSHDLFYMPHSSSPESSRQPSSAWEQLHQTAITTLGTCLNELGIQLEQFYIEPPIILDKAVNKRREMEAKAEAEQRRMRALHQIEVERARSMQQFPSLFQLSRSMPTRKLDLDSSEDEEHISNAESSKSKTTPVASGTQPFEIISRPTSKSGSHSGSPHSRDGSDTDDSVGEAVGTTSSLEARRRHSK